MQKSIVRFYNCTLIKDECLLKQDLWIKNGKVYDYLDDNPNLEIDCKNLFISPGFIDIQINGGFGCDFSNTEQNIESSIKKFSKLIVKHGVTSFCPTIITSKNEFYLKTLSKIKPKIGNKDIGANNLGFHLEGPFINSKKCGAHPKDLIQDKIKFNFKQLKDFYGGDLENIRIITLAPELFDPIIFSQLNAENIVSSMGHSEATFEIALNAYENGCNLITHLFNAMQPFHHRNPGIIGLLGQKNYALDLNKNKCDKQLYFTIISDNVHTHNVAVNIAYKCNLQGLILVTDGVSYLGSDNNSSYKIGNKNIQIINNQAFVDGTQTLCGSVVSLNCILNNFKKTTNCSLNEAIATVTSKPAKILNIYPSKGSLQNDCDADLVIIDENFRIFATFVNGELTWADSLIQKNLTK